MSEKVVQYEIDEESRVVVCKHKVTYKNETTGEKTSYNVVGTHNFGDLSMRALLKLAAMQGKIKRKEEMGIGANGGKLEFSFDWTDADVDGKTRAAKPVDPKIAMDYAKTLRGMELQTFLAELQEIADNES